MKYAILNNVVPCVVGLAALMLVDDNLPYLNNPQIKMWTSRTEVKLAVLFGAAYAANGAKILPAIIALYIYYLLSTNEERLTKLVDQVDDKMNNDEKSDDEAKAE